MSRNAAITPTGYRNLLLAGSTTAVAIPATAIVLIIAEGWPAGVTLLLAIVATLAVAGCLLVLRRHRPDAVREGEPAPPWTLLMARGLRNVLALYGAIVLVVQWLSYIL